MNWDAFTHTLIASVVYSLLGIVMFGLSFWVINLLTPFSLRKELEEDQNTALAIVIASVIIGLSLIIAAAVGG